MGQCNLQDNLKNKFLSYEIRNISYEENSSPDPGILVSLVSCILQCVNVIIF